MNWNEDCDVSLSISPPVLAERRQEKHAGRDDGPAERGGERI